MQRRGGVTRAAPRGVIAQFGAKPNANGQRNAHTNGDADRDGHAHHDADRDGHADGHRHTAPR